MKTKVRKYTGEASWAPIAHRGPGPTQHLLHQLCHCHPHSGSKSPHSVLGLPDFLYLASFQEVQALASCLLPARKPCQSLKEDWKWGRAEEMQPWGGGWCSPGTCSGGGECGGETVWAELAGAREFNCVRRKERRWGKGPEGQQCVQSGCPDGV